MNGSQKHRHSKTRTPLRRSIHYCNFPRVSLLYKNNHQRGCRSPCELDFLHCQSTISSKQLTSTTISVDIRKLSSCIVLSDRQPSLNQSTIYKLCQATVTELILFERKSAYLFTSTKCRAETARLLRTNALVVIDESPVWHHQSFFHQIRTTITHVISDQRVSIASDQPSSNIDNRIVKNQYFEDSDDKTIDESSKETTKFGLSRIMTRTQQVVRKRTKKKALHAVQRPTPHTALKELLMNSFQTDLKLTPSARKPTVIAKKKKKRECTRQQEDIDKKWTQHRPSGLTSFPNVNRSRQTIPEKHLTTNTRPMFNCFYRPLCDELFFQC